MPRAILRLDALEERTVPATVGALDPSFGTTGRVTTSVGGTEAASAVAIQPDGKIIVAGSTTQNNDIILARYNPDGALDSTFNGSGTFQFTFGGVDTAAALVLQPDGMIVVVGATDVNGSPDFAVARVLANGTGLDPAFSGDGKVIVPFDLGGANADRAAAVALQADGRIVVVGSVQAGATDFDFGLLRLTAAGALDTSFGGSGLGVVAFNLGGANDDRATGVTIAPGGAIVVGGYAETAAGSHDFAAVRLLAADGAPDTTFSGDGKATVDLGGDDVANAVAVRADGRMVLAGTRTATDVQAAVAQLTAVGAPDTSFGTAGATVVQFALTLYHGFRANALALDDRGRVIIAGAQGDLGNSGSAFVLRMTANGVIDSSFNAPPGNQPRPADGPFGTSGIDFGGDDAAAAVAIDRNGRIVVAGGTSADGNIALARLIGSVEKGARLAVGGSTDGTAQVLAPNAAAAAVAAFGSTAANVRTAVADVNGDGIDDTILVTGPGVPIRVAVVSGVDNATLLVAPFNPYTDEFTGGGFVAAGDFDGDGRAEFVLTADQGGGPRVVVYTRDPAGSATVRASFLGIDDANFRGGARAAVGDVNGDGRPDLIIAAGFGGGPRVAVFGGASVLSSPTRLVSDFFAFPGADAQNLRNGAFVAAGDVDGDGFADLVFGGGPGGAPRVFILSGALVSAGNFDGAYAAPVANFFVAGNAADRGGVRVAVSDLDGDQKADVSVGSGEASPARVRIYFGANVTTTGEPATFQDVTVFGGASLPGGVFVG